MLNFGSFSSFLNGRAARQEATRRQVRGLYYPPKGGEVYESHRTWAGAQQAGSNAVMALALVATNPSIHRCRIGKITLKTAA